MNGPELLSLIRNRSKKKTSFGRGILTADKYVKSMANMAGLDVCYSLASTNQVSFDDIIQKAAKTLVYSNDNMGMEEKVTSTHGFKKLLDGASEKVKLPKNTLMVFRHKLTTSMEDRDKDILRSDGMELDSKMLLLWQHIHTMPLGPYLYTVSQDSKEVRVVSAIVDMNQTTHDAAVMVDNGMGRFSHGFNALEFEKRKDRKGKLTGGFDIKRAEIMEESLVSVPANPGAETEEVLLSLVEGGKLKSPMMKSIGRTLREKRNVQSTGISIKYREVDGSVKKELQCASLQDLQKAAEMGIISTSKQEDKKDDENESRNGTEEKSRESGNESIPSEETHENDGEKEVGDEGSTNVPEVKDVNDLEEKNVYLDFDGSYEKQTDDLRNQIKSKYNIYPRIMATYSDYVIYSVYGTHHKMYDSEDKSENSGHIKYYHIKYKVENGIPILVGDSEEIELSIDITKKSIEKAGRVISKVNEAKIEDAIEDLKEMARMEGVDRTAKALVVNAYRSLIDVLGSIGKQGQTAYINNIVNIKQAMGLFIGEATAEERAKMKQILTAFDSVQETKDRTERYQKLKN